MFYKFRVGSGTLKSRSRIRIRNKIIPDPQHCFVGWVAGSEPKQIIPDPKQIIPYQNPEKNSGSLRIRIRKTDCNTKIYLVILSNFIVGVVHQLANDFLGEKEEELVARGRRSLSSLYIIEFK
jgi:hypothetical protein